MIKYIKYIKNEAYNGDLVVSKQSAYAGMR